MKKPVVLIIMMVGVTTQSKKGMQLLWVRPPTLIITKRITHIP